MAGMKFPGVLVALALVLATIPSNPPAARGADSARAPLVCGAEDDGAGGAKLSDIEFAGIVPGRGLSEEDFADGGMVIVVDPSLYLITDDPIGVITRAAHNWEIPGTMIKFRVTDQPTHGGNLIHAEDIRPAARANLGRPGWGHDGNLEMTLDVPFNRGDESLVSVVTHEMGHWLGFDHSFLGSTVMFPVLTDRINWVDPDQTAKAVARYGVGPSALGEVRGRVTLGGAPLSGARINLLGSNDRTAFGTFSGTDGDYHLPVFAGTYRVVVDPNDGPAVKGNFFGTYPGGPLDYVTLEVPGSLVVSAGQTITSDVDVPTGGDFNFRITTDEPTICSPGGGVQGVKIYYAGANRDEIASVEPLSSDMHVVNLTDRGGILDVYVDVDRSALPGPRGFRVRKTNGAVAIVTGIVGVVAPFWLDAPTYTVEAATPSPVSISWFNRLPRDEASITIVSASVDGGGVWEPLARVAPQTTSFTWEPDEGLTTSAMRVRIESFDAVGDRLAIDESIFNIGLGRPARGDVTGGVDTTAPTVEVLTPNGGETFASGEPVRIRWTADDEIGIAAQELEVSADGGRRWTSVGALGPSARSFDYTPDARSIDELLVRVTARDIAGNATTDASDAPAQVRARPEVSKVTSKPKGGDLQLKIKGSGLSGTVVVRINGETVAAPVSGGASGGTLKLRGTAEALHLNPAGQTNTLVVEVDGLASSEFIF